MPRHCKKQSANPTHVTGSPGKRPGRLFIYDSHTMRLDHPKLAIVMGLVTASVAAFAGYHAVLQVAQWREAQHWTPVIARIGHLDLVGDEDAYEVRCEYTYVFAGQEHHGSRVGLEGQGDNMGTWHKEIYRSLSNSKASTGTVNCYVDPRQPERAVLFRDFRLAVLCFYLVFVVGFSMFPTLFIMCLFRDRRLRREMIRRSSVVVPSAEYSADRRREARLGMVVFASFFLIVVSLIAVPVGLRCVGDGDVIGFLELAGVVILSILCIVQWCRRRTASGQ